METEEYTVRDYINKTKESGKSIVEAARVYKTALNEITDKYALSNETDGTPGKFSQLEKEALELSIERMKLN